MKYTVALNQKSQYLIYQLQNEFYLKIWKASPLEIDHADFFFWDSNEKIELISYFNESLHLYCGYSNNTFITDFINLPFSIEVLKQKIGFFKI